MVINISVGNAWDVLRGARSVPPGLAASSRSRRRVFSASLEQAEQFFRAAAAVGPATQPVLVFYGLSQAGRAIAASAKALPGDRWELVGHGIHTVEPQRPLTEVRVTTDPAGNQGSFVRLSELLDSPVWGREPVTLAELWDCLPLNTHAPLDPAHTGRTTPLLVAHRSLSDEPHPLASVPVTYFPPRVLEADDTVTAFLAYLEHFPDALGYDSYVRKSMNGPEPALDRYQDGWSEVVMNWADPEGRHAFPDEHLDRLRRITRRHNGAWYFTPAVAKSARGIHPLMAWWAVLHALSTLARYQPAQWARHIDVDASVHAVPIERLLAKACHVLPVLIAETLDEATT
ncbi:YaaC family protein [Kitasatospora sp. NPDC057692]|uniref:YaaC family protein n=1 Tax=Kitasatospora sp. NPDC057692 TaxID=3346215 RepID=UPI003682051D